MNPLTDLEFRILDELYFLTSFDTLIQNLGEEKIAIVDALKDLLAQELVTQLKIDKGEEVKFEKPDFNELEVSHYVASKKGLLLHNSRN